MTFIAGFCDAVATGTSPAACILLCAVPAVSPTVLGTVTCVLVLAAVALIVTLLPDATDVPALGDVPDTISDDFCVLGATGTRPVATIRS